MYPLTDTTQPQEDTHMSNIRETLLAEAPTLAAEYFEYFEKFYQDNVEELGHEWLSNAYDGRRDRWNHVIVRCFDHQQGETIFDKEIVTFNTDKLQKLADAYGEETATEWASKIESKLVNVTGIKFRRLGRGSFAFRGERNGHAVSLMQQTVTKVSNRGTWFHQFPARIYVNGQFMSEKAYKEMFKDELAETEQQPEPRRESFSSKKIDGRYVTANAQAYSRQRELKAEGIKSRVTGDAGYATITYRK